MNADKRREWTAGPQPLNRGLPLLAQRRPVDHSSLHPLIARPALSGESSPRSHDVACHVAAFWPPNPSMAQRGVFRLSSSYELYQLAQRSSADRCEFTRELTWASRGICLLSPCRLPPPFRLIAGRPPPLH